MWLLLVTVGSMVKISSAKASQKVMPMSKCQSRYLRDSLFLTMVVALCLTVPLAARPSSSVLTVADAAMSNDSDAVRSLLVEGADVNEAQGDGMTALHWAALNGDAELAEMLFYAGANVNAATRLGAYTPLFLAAKSGSAPIVKKLLEDGADVNVAASTGTTPLMLASSSGSVEVVDLLLDYGAEIDEKEIVRGHTALMFAVGTNRLEVLARLLDRGADPALVTIARDVEKMEDEARKEREERGQRVSQPTDPVPQPVKKVKSGGNVFSKIFSWLPGVGDAKPEPKTKEVRRSRRKRRSFGSLVGQHGGLAPLHFAARQGYTGIVDELLEHGADINQLSGDNSTALLIATLNGHFDLAKHFVEKGADVTLASDGGSTPLYAAVNCQWGPRSMYPQPKAQHQQSTSYLDLMELFLNEGADVNARVNKKLWYTNFVFDLSGVDEIGATPFWRAAYASDVEAMRLLKNYGADHVIATKKPDQRPPTGGGTRELEDVSGLPPVPVGGPALMPLHAATGAGYGEGFAANSHAYSPAGWLPAVKYLVEELGADVNQPDHEGYTPLHHAATRGSDANELIKYLVSKGGDVTTLSRDGMTVADMANSPVQRVPPFLDTVDLLVEMGSTITPGKCVAC